jgi:hypothetical protein
MVSRQNLTGQIPTVQNLPGHNPTVQNTTGHKPHKLNYKVIIKLHFIKIICCIQLDPIDTNANCNLYFNGLQLQQIFMFSIK